MQKRFENNNKLWIKSVWMKVKAMLWNAQSNLNFEQVWSGKDQKRFAYGSFPICNSDNSQTVRPDKTNLRNWLGQRLPTTGIHPSIGIKNRVKVSDMNTLVDS